MTTAFPTQCSSCLADGFCRRRNGYGYAVRLGGRPRGIGRGRVKCAPSASQRRREIRRICIFPRKSQCLTIGRELSIGNNRGTGEVEHDTRRRWIELALTNGRDSALSAAADDRLFANEFQGNITGA